MRTYNQTFHNLNQSVTREPVFVVELSFDLANTDVYFLTSETVPGLTGNIINNTIRDISSTSQKINPEKALSTIGSITFECVDNGLTDLQRTKLDAGSGLKGKRVRVYKGFRGQDWSTFEIIQTQVISSDITFKESGYTFQCSDVQRELRKDIFDLKETALASSISASTTTIPVFDTSQFQMVKQPTSPSGVTDAPGQTVGYLKIENDDQVEIIRYTGKTAGSFTGCTRGVLGTRPLAVEVNTSDADKATKVEEYVYLEMAAPKLIYALLTGVIYGQPEGLPSHWHLGLSANYVKTSDFEEIGNDWWDLSDNDAGVPATVRGVGKTDGKRFIEQELLIMLGAFMPIYANGEIGLKRMNSIIGKGGYDRALTVDNVVSYGELKHDLSSVVNQIVIAWNYVEARGGFTRRNVLIDPDSIAKNGKSKPLVLELRALESSRHSYSTIKSRFDAIRERYAGPPLRISLTLTPTENALEVGDIVRVILPQVQDYTNSDTNLNRNFEVQRVQQDWVTGSVKVDLFGSSAVASAIPEDTPDVDVGSPFWGSQGTEINATTFPGAVTVGAGVTTITGTITLNGGSNVNSSGSIFYSNQDLTLQAGAKIIINDNVQIRVKGFFQVNGEIDGKGRGFSGGVGISQTSTEQYGNNGAAPYNTGSSYDFYQSANLGQKGFIDPVRKPHRGGVLTPNGNASTPFAMNLWPDLDGEISQGGSRNSAPILDLKVVNDNLVGVPGDLRGSSGAGGGVIAFFDRYFHAVPQALAGSNGGAGGAGLLIVSKGADIGANGKIDTSGVSPSTQAVTEIRSQYQGWNAFCGNIRHCSGAGGACGAVYWIMVGSGSTAPNLDIQNSVATIAANTVIQNTTDDIRAVTDTVYKGVRYLRTISNPGKTVSMPYYGQPLASFNAFQACHKVQYVNFAVAIESDVSAYASDATFSLTEFVNTPKTSAGDRSTIEVSITPPVGDDSYSYSRVQYRKQGNTAWNDAEPSSFESTFQVKSDGTTYEVRTRSVSTSGFTSPSGPIQTITTTNVVGRSNLDLQSIYPLATINNLSLDETGNNFTGLGPNFEWDDDNNQLVYFSHYEVSIYNGGTVLRTEKSVSPFYTYSVDKNRADYKAQTTNDGFYSTIEIRVKPVSRYLNDLGALYSGSTATFTVYASTVNDPNNLLYYVIPSKTSDLADDANLGGTANWDDVSGANKPQDNATNGATWEDNIAGQPDRQNVLNNLVDISDWALGAPIPSSLSTESYGFSDANSLVVADGPFDFDEIVWQVKAVSLANDDGGFSFRNSVQINPAKVYRVSCWFRAVSLNGTLRFSPSNSSILRTLSTNIVQTEPYQHNAAAPENAKWFLAVMVIHPHNTTRVSTSGRSGIYDPDTNTIVSYFDEFKFTPGATTLNTHFQYINIGNTTDYVWFSRPRLEVIDGSEQRLSALLGTPPDFYLEVNKSLAMVNVNSVGSKLSGPSNVTTSKVSTGRYRITHNSGYSGKGVVVSARSSSIRATMVSSETSVKFDVFLYNSAGTATDSAFTLIMDPDYR